MIPSIQKIILTFTLEKYEIHKRLLDAFRLFTCSGEIAKQTESSKFDTTELSNR